MKRRVLFPLAALFLAGATLALIQTPAKAVHRFTKVTDTIYGAVATGSLVTGSNSGVIINDKEVLVVDSHITPAAGHPASPGTRRPPTKTPARMMPPQRRRPH